MAIDESMQKFGRLNSDDVSALTKIYSEGNSSGQVPQFGASRAEPYNPQSGSALNYIRNDINFGNQLGMDSKFAKMALSIVAPTTTPKPAATTAPQPTTTPQPNSALQSIQTLPSGVTEYAGANGERAFTNVPESMRNSFVPNRGTGAIQPDQGLISAYNAAAQMYRDMRTSQYPTQQVNIVGGYDPIQKEREWLINTIQNGLTTNIPGQRLTVGGLQALMGRLNNLNQYDAARRGQDIVADTDIAKARIQAQNGLDIQAMRNNSPEALARTAAIYQNLGRIKLAPAEFPNLVTDEMRLSSPQEAAKLDQIRMMAQALYGRLFQEAGGNVANIAERLNNFSQTLQKQINEGKAPPNAEMQKQAIQYIWAVLGDLAAKSGGYIPSMAEGGIVAPPQMPPQMPLQMPPQSSPAAIIQNYQQYVGLAKSLGLPPMSIDQFLQKSGSAIPSTPQGGAPMPPETMPQATPAQMGIMGFAGGGVIPDPRIPSAIASVGEQVDGKLVVDPNPAAPTDSIPAMIDGRYPAALDSGEMVLPKDVVMYYGTEKLTKMIEQARAKMGGQNSGVPNQ